MGYTVLATGLVLIVVAWACYQYPNLINPYGNMSPEQKELVNIEGLKKAVALILGPTGFLLVVTATLHLLKVVDEDVCGITLMVLVFAMMVPLTVAMRRYNAFGLWSLNLWLHCWEEKYLLNCWLASHKDCETVDTDTDT